MYRIELRGSKFFAYKLCTLFTEHDKLPPIYGLSFKTKYKVCLI